MAGDITYIQPAGRPLPAGHYSPGVVAGGFVFVAGQLPTRDDGTAMGGAPFADQVQQVLANVQAVLVAAGSSVAQLVQVRVYVTDMQLWGEFNRIYAQWAGPAKPARAVVPVPTLNHGVMIEVEAVALV
jgi:2-iminobutanoate/2-iminopropanoate deaminase